jgi:hypothetical protein
MSVKTEAKWPTEDPTPDDIQEFLENFEGPYDNLVLVEFKEHPISQTPEAMPTDQIEQIRFYWGEGIAEGYGNKLAEAILYRDDHTNRDWERLIEITSQDRYDALRAKGRYYDLAGAHELSRLVFDTENQQAELVHVRLFADDHMPLGLVWEMESHTIAEGTISYQGSVRCPVARSAKEMMDGTLGIESKRYTDIDEHDCRCLKETGERTGAEGRLVALDEQASEVVFSAARDAGINETAAAGFIGRDVIHEPYRASPLTERGSAAKDVSARRDAARAHDGRPAQAPMRTGGRQI